MRSSVKQKPARRYPRSQLTGKRFWLSTVFLPPQNAHFQKSRWSSRLISSPVFKSPHFSWNVTAALPCAPLTHFGKKTFCPTLNHQTSTLVMMTGKRRFRLVIHDTIVGPSRREGKRPALSYPVCASHGSTLLARRETNKLHLVWEGERGYF